MYIIKYTDEGWHYTATLLTKEWSEDMLSYVIVAEEKKKFPILLLAKRWARKRLYNILLEQQKVEINYGRK